MKEFNKLVRDKIPEIIAKNGESANYYVASNEEMMLLIRKKLLEEATEVYESQNKAALIEELADLKEVYLTILQLEGLNDSEDIEPIRLEKKLKKGSFAERYVLISTTDGEEDEK